MKDPLALLSAEWLYERFDMEVVVLVRHPAAFVGSLKKGGSTFPFEDLRSQETLMSTKLAPYRSEIRKMVRDPGSIVEQAALLWACLNHVVSVYRDRYPSWHVVRYEDLATDPRTHFSRLYEKLCLPWRAMTGKKIERRTDSNLYRWRDRLEAFEIDYVRRTTREVWKEFYVPRDWSPSEDTA